MYIILKGEVKIKKEMNLEWDKVSVILPEKYDVGSPILSEEKTTVI
jgi:hypothetical protein